MTGQGVQLTDLYNNIGATIGPIVEWLRVEKAGSVEKGMGEELVYRALDHITSGVEDIIGHHGRHWWMHKMASINAKYINPIFTRNAFKQADQQIIR